MQTYTHFLWTALAGNRLPARMDVRLKPLLLGSVLPDVPLVLLTLGYLGYRPLFDPFGPGEFIFDRRYDDLYFRDPFWITGHNLLHAPPVLLLLFVASSIAIRNARGWGRSLRWFAVGCVFHSVLDIVSHHDDGPLLLFPFDWSLRFASPISYWDRDYHAGIVGPIEHLADGLILVYFAVSLVRFSWTRRTARAEASGKRKPSTSAGEVGG